MYKTNYIKACLVFFLSGIYVLSIGVILPDMITQWQLSYRYAGILLSMIATGNLLANFLVPFIARFSSQRVSLSILAGTIPFGFLLIFLSAPHTQNFLWLGFLGLGLGRGAVSVINNALVNDLGENKSKDMNIMHMIFAIGAFIAAFIVVFLKQVGLSLNAILIYLMIVGTFEWFVAMSMHVDYEVSPQDTQSYTIKRPRNRGYWLIALLLFFYVGVENTINGWFITYLEESNILSERIAQTLVSLTWLMIMFGRIFTARISNHKNSNRIILIFSIGAALGLMAAMSIQIQTIIVISMLILGFFLAGIYPTSIANASPYVHGQQSKLALLMTIASLGGIVTPQIIGYLADQFSIVHAVNFLVINLSAMVLFAFLSYRESKSI